MTKYRPMENILTYKRHSVLTGMLGLSYGGSLDLLQIAQSPFCWEDLQSLVQMSGEKKKEKKERVTKISRQLNRLEPCKVRTEVFKPSYNVNVNGLYGHSFKYHEGSDTFHCLSVAQGFYCTQCSHRSLPTACLIAH